MQNTCQKTDCANLDCDFVHSYKYCYQYQNTKCTKKNCPYLHCTSVEQYRYMITGKPTDNLKREVGRTLQSVNVCGDLKKNTCKRTNCNRRHIHNTLPLECPICREIIVMESFGAGIWCGHIFCYNCALHLINNNDEEMIVQCPICRIHVKYKQLK